MSRRFWALGCMGLWVLSCFEFNDAVYVQGELFKADAMEEKGERARMVC